MADWSVLRSLVIGSAGMGGGLALFTLTAHHPVPGVLTVLVIAALGSVLVVNLQLRLMHVAGEAQTLGAAMNHSALNAANALGAWLGGLVIAAGFGWTSPSWVGVGLSAGGLVMLGLSLVLNRRDSRHSAARIRARR